MAKNKMGLPIAEGVAIIALIIGLFAKGNLDKTTIAQKESEIQEVQTQLQAKDSELAELGTLSEDYASLKEEYAKLEATNSELTAAIETAESEKQVLVAAAEEAGAKADSADGEEADSEADAEEASVEGVDGQDAAAQLSEEQEAALAAKDSELAAKNDELAAKDSALADQEAALAEKDSLIADQEAALAEKDTALAEKDTALAEKDTALAEKDTALAEKDTALAEKDSELAAKDEDFKAKEQQYQEQAAALQDQIAEILGVRGQIIDKLQGIFDETDLPVIINKDNGIITINSNVLFEFASSELTASGKALLDEVLPQYFDVVFSDEAREYISEIMIEGHTDTVGDFIYNMDLSQQRAYAVAEYCLGEKSTLSDVQKSKLENAITVNGKSYSAPVLDTEGNIDADASRRVEIKFRLISDELLSQVEE